MKIEVARKYFNSRINGVLIRCIDVMETKSKRGEVVIVDEKGNRFNYYIDPSDMYEGISADAILCRLQDHKEINVSKY